MKSRYLTGLAIFIFFLPASPRPRQGASSQGCMRDGNTYYVLSYDAPPADGANEYHAIEVKIDQAQLKAQTRSGYYAQPTRPHMP